MIGGAPAAPAASPIFNPIDGGHPTDLTSIPQYDFSAYTGGGDNGGGGGGGGGGGFNFNFPSITPPAAPAKTPYDINADPSVILARLLQQHDIGQLQSQYNLKRSQIMSPYIGSGGGGNIGAASLAAAAEDAKAQKEQLAHQLPITLRNIMNALAAHGLASSGDTTYLPGEANYAYNQDVSAVDRALKERQASVAEQRAAYAASEAASMQRYQQGQQQDLASLDLWMNQSKDTEAQNLAKAYVAAYQQALSNPAIYLTSTGDITSLINQALGGGK